MTTRKLSRLAFEHAFNPQKPCRMIDFLLDLGLAFFAQFERERHVVIDAHMRIEGIVLEDHSDITLFGLLIIHQSIPDIDITAGDFLQAGDQAQHGGLTATRRADEHHKLFVFSYKADIFDGMKAVIIILV